jgi:hypothetical protein
MAPLWLEGIRGKKSTPSVGWEVPTRSHQVGKRELDGAHGTTTLEHSHLAKVRIVKFVTCNEFNLHMLLSTVGLKISFR